jgi:prepilin-type N-terminal cleavage/methylation domain-containing protein/prepilin-type processing-associated H-X9-DG protein
MSRRRGFTLIELLVVISIIAILAAMLFPVFARARESARKIQCLSNVKNIAMAFQLYFTDFDRYPPMQHDQTVNQALYNNGCSGALTPGCCASGANLDPYLRWPVILDEYIKNRDVWRCPSAKYPSFALMVYGSPNWWAEAQAYWPCCACAEHWPNGWGGTVTDNIAPVNGCPTYLTADQNPFEYDYADTHAVAGETEKKLSAIDDPAKTLVIAERGYNGSFDRVEKIAYPEACRITWTEEITGRCTNDGMVASTEEPCDATTVTKWWGDPSWRRQYTRHLGGNNLGFADGHAAWMAADAIMHAAAAGDLAPLHGMRIPAEFGGGYF